jgi:hypothetical protein|tara:strand:- start:1374 stop:1895 length:522 start_codon:yes stop_codon:yes gene_type:complete
MNEQYQQDVLRELNFAHTEDKQEELESPIDNSIELEMFQWNPKAEKSFPDINSDWLAGNINENEEFSINMNNELHNSIVAMKSGLKAQWKDLNNEDKESIATFFLPSDLIQAPKRRIYSILALSNSKDGFWRKLSRTRYIQRGFQYEDNKQEEKNLSWIPFLSRKRKKQQEMF